MDANRQADQPASLSGGTTPHEIGEFWDTHDFTEYESASPDVTEEIEIDIRSTHHLVAVEPELLQEAIISARRQGVAVRTVVGQALREFLSRSDSPNAGAGRAAKSREMDHGGK